MNDAPLHSEPTSAEASRVAPASKDLVRLLEDLTGQRVPLPSPTAPQRALDLLEGEGRALGYSQLNELFLLLGYDRITPAFFQYLVDGHTEYEPGAALISIDQLREGVDRFRKLALLLFGNVKYAFKNLSRSSEELELWLDFFAPLTEASFSSRHDPVQPLAPIAGHDTFYLGYLVQRELAERLQKNPEDGEAAEAEAKR